MNLLKFQFLTDNTIAQLILNSYFYRKKYHVRNHRNMVHKDLSFISRITVWEDFFGHQLSFVLAIML